MRKLVLIAVILVGTQNYAFSQFEALSSLPSGFKFGLQYTNWVEPFDSSIDEPYRNIGVDLYQSFNFKNKTERLKFNIGFGVSTVDFHTNIRQFSFDSGQVPLIRFRPEDEFQKNKLSIVYLDIPVHFSYNTNPDKKMAWSFGLGFKAGYAVDAKTKWKETINDERVVFKIKSFENINRLRYGPTASISYGPFMLFGFYSMASTFDAVNALNYNAYSIGLALSNW